jgi:uncharacterized glyoxalase superfamily protein PhnB
VAEAPEAVIPVLVYKDIEAAHDFLVRAFGFTPGGLHRDDDGRVVHGEVGAGGRPIWLHAVVSELQMGPPSAATVAYSGLVVRVPDVDAHFARAQAEGALIIREPSDQEYGQREYEARDPEGHRWWFATVLPS